MSFTRDRAAAPDAFPLRGCRHVVAAVAGEEVAGFELGLATEVFGLDRSELVDPWYEFRLVAAAGGPIHVSDGGYTITTPLRPLTALQDDFTLVSGMRIPYSLTSAEAADVPPAGAFRDFHGGGAGPLVR